MTRIISKYASFDFSSATLTANSAFGNSPRASSLFIAAAEKEKRRLLADESYHYSYFCLIKICSDIERVYFLEKKTLKNARHR